MELCAEIDEAMSHGNKAVEESVSFSVGFDTEVLEEELAELLDGSLEEGNDESTPQENLTQASPKRKGNESTNVVFFSIGNYTKTRFQPFSFLPILINGCVFISGCGLIVI